MSTLWLELCVLCSRAMWAGAHETVRRKSKTLVMNSRSIDYGIKAYRIDPGARNQKIGHVSIIPDWCDAELMSVADLTCELAGQMVVPAAGEDDQTVFYSPAITQNRLASSGDPGFLFNGDDGDSLWFWPESEPVAFRLEHEKGNGLRMQLSETVDRLVNQGALVFCYRVRSDGTGDQMFEFPEFVDEAA